MTRPRSDRLDAYFDCLAANCPPALQAWIATSEREFSAAVEQALDTAILQLECGASRARAMDEFDLTWLLLELLASASIPTVLGEHNGGHVNVTVKHPAGRAILMHGICTVYEGYDHHLTGCGHLLARCSNGRSGRGFS